MSNEQYVKVNDVIEQFEQAMKYADVSTEEREKIIAFVLKNMDNV